MTLPGMPLPGAEGPRLLRGGPIAATIREQVAADVESFRAECGHAPALAVVIVGRDAPSTVYLHKILDGCRLVGIEDRNCCILCRNGWLHGRAVWTVAIGQPPEKASRTASEVPGRGQNCDRSYTFANQLVLRYESPPI